MKHWAHDLIGVPFLDNGRDTDGLDCWGLVKLVHKRLYGWELPDVVYTDTRDRRIPDLIDAQRKLWTPVAFDSWREGTVLVLRVAGLPFHTGAVIEPPARFIHAQRGVGVVIGDVTSSRWSNRIIGAYDYAG